MKEVKPIKIKDNMKVSELVGGMSEMGFGAGNISRASLIMKKMFDDEGCKVFLGVAGAMVPAGMKNVILGLLDDVDVFVTTGANLTHDLIESLGEKHYQMEENISDEELHEKGIDRIYNVFMKNVVYEKLEDFFEKNFDEFKKCENIREFLWKIGEILSRSADFSPAPNYLNPHIPLADARLSVVKNPQLAKDNLLKPNQSILAKCYEKKIPIFCPGIADSGIGLMMWSMTAVQSFTASSDKHPNQGRIAGGKGKTNIDVFSDMNEIIDIAWTSKKNGVIYVGGGLPKNFIQQALQFSKGADYGIQITTDRQESGGSSGASLKEGISWGKMKKDADFVDVFCDATIALPLIYASIKN